MMIRCCGRSETGIYRAIILTLWSLLVVCSLLLVVVVVVVAFVLLVVLILLVVLVLDSLRGSSVKIGDTEKISLAPAQG